MFEFLYFLINFLTVVRSTVLILLSAFYLKPPKKWCPLKNRKKSIRGFCPHRLCGVRQSLTKPWVQRNVCKNPLSVPSNWGVVPSPHLQWSQHLVQKPLRWSFIVDKWPLTGHFILMYFLKKTRQKQATFFHFFAHSWLKRPLVFTYNTSDLRVLFYHLWINFYSIKDYCSKKCGFTWVRKGFYEKMKNYEKTITVEAKHKRQI